MGANGSGRKKSPVDLDSAIDLLMRGEKIPAISAELGISAPTLRTRIAEISKQQGLLLQYRSIQSLQLTELQARILEAITPDKINDAPLRDLVMSFKILKDKEQVIEGKPSEIKGLVAHLIHLEKLEKNPELKHELIDAEYTDSYTDSYDSLGESSDQNITDLAFIDDSEF